MAHTEDKFELPFTVKNSEVAKEDKVEIVDENNSLKIMAAVFTIIDE